MEDWNTQAFGPLAGGKPEKIVLMLHGVGSNGQDLIALAPYLAQAAPKAVFLSPDAPQRYDMAPFGRQWFSLQSYAPEILLAQIKASAPVLNDYIDDVLREYGLADSDLVMLGFSQGSMMSLYAAPRRGKPIAGVIAYSGALIGAEELREAHIHKIPVCLIHGEADNVVTIDRFKAARDALKNSAFEVEDLSIPGLPHSIDEAGIAKGAAFLKKVLAQ